MARKKVKLAWISNDSSRRGTYKKRKKGLVKKVSELSILCGVKACAIIYGPGDREAEVWPSIPGVQEVALRFKSLPEMEQSKKMMNQEGFISQRIAKLKEQLKKLQKDNREMEIAALMFQCLSGSVKSFQGADIEYLSDLAWLLDSKMKMVQERIEAVRGSMSKYQPKEERMKIRGGEERTGLEVVTVDMEALQKQQWLIDGFNPHYHMGYGGEDLVMPFGDNNPWFDPYSYLSSFP